MIQTSINNTYKTNLEYTLHSSPMAKKLLYLAVHDLIVGVLIPLLIFWSTTSCWLSATVYSAPPNWRQLPPPITQRHAMQGPT